MIRVTIWNEFRHEQRNEAIRAIYPEGIHGTLARQLGTDKELTIRTATLDMPEHGLSQDVLDDTDVLIWWGHIAHGEVSDTVVDRVQARVLDGMGLICLHSAHASKIFHRMMGTRTADLRWREDGELCRLWIMDPQHPIAAGLTDYIDIPHDETYGEHFCIPAPDALVFVSWFPGGEVFRSGCCWKRGLGKIFYFQPGHETFPVYEQPEVVKIIDNAVHWTAQHATYKPHAGHCTKLNG